MKLTDIKGCGTSLVPNIAPPNSRYVVYWQKYTKPRQLGWYRAPCYKNLYCGLYQRNSWYRRARVSLCPRCFKATGIEW